MNIAFDRENLRTILRDPDVLFPSIAALIVLICALLLYDNLTSSRGAGSEPIGKIHFKNRVAQRKFSAATLWGELETNSIVYNRDTIRTEDLSEAVIELNDGTRIEMDENSMIVLNISQAEAEIDFAYGAIQARSSTARAGEEVELKISKGDKVVKATDGDVKLAGGKDDEDLVVTLESGQAVIEKDGEATELQENQRAVVSKEKIEVKPLVLRLSAPREHEQFFTGQGAAPVNFSWSKGEAQEVRLEVSRDRSFTRVAAATAAAGSGAALRLPDGNYYWRISGRDGQGQRQTSSVRRFRVIERKQLQLFSPLNDQKFSYTAEPPLVNFSWNKDDFASGYELEISGSRDFSGARKVATLTTSVSRALEPGTYYWRVSTRSARQGAATQSGVFRFSVSQLQKQEPPRPQHPRGRTIHQVLLKKQGEMFNWLGNRELANYEMEIARDAGFGAKVLSRTTDGNFVRIREDLAAGAYFWRVRGRDRRGLWTDFSTPAAFQVGATEKLRLNAPAPNATINVFELGARGLSLDWQPAGLQGQYRVTLARNAALNGADNFPPGRNSALRLPELEAGTYYWKVTLLDGDQVVTESEVRSFRITADLPAPVITFPARGGRVDMTRRDSLDFVWQAVPGAREYEVVFSRPVAGRIEVLARQRLRGTVFRFTELNALDRGRFVFEVRATTRQAGRRVQSEPARSDFTIDLQTLGKPELDSPRDLFIKE